MNIYLQSQDVTLTPSIDAHVRKEIMHYLSKAGGHITSVKVFVSDINGPRGGTDQKVVICVDLANHALVKIEKTHANLFAAISVSARQASRAVKRTLRKRKRINRPLLRGLRLQAV
ncbi:MAG: HPF/RaiA family ribosome-associated protein [Pseudomonadales bacterium]